MTIQNQTITPSELILRVSEETQCLMDMRRVSKEHGDLPDIPEEQDEIIQLYQNGITRIGKAWDLQTEAAAAREQLRNTAPEQDETETWSLTEAQILGILWGLFETIPSLPCRLYCSPPSALPCRPARIGSAACCSNWRWRWI